MDTIGNFNWAEKEDQRWHRFPRSTSRRNDGRVSLAKKFRKTRGKGKYPENSVRKKNYDRKSKKPPKYKIGNLLTIQRTQFLNG